MLAKKRSTLCSPRQISEPSHWRMVAYTGYPSCWGGIGVFAKGAGGGGSPPVLKKIRAKRRKFGQNAENSGKITKFGPKFDGFFIFLK